MKKCLILLAVMAGCGSSNEPGSGNASGVSETSERGRAPSPAAEPVDETRLTGLYESGPETQRNQLCIVEKNDGGSAQFGIVVWGANMHSCSGAGEATREGGTLRLRMAGDSACEIRATIDGGTVTLPASLPEGCAYYCGARARFSGASLTRVGSTPADAMKATDLAGDPLCDAGSVAPG